MPEMGEKIKGHLLLSFLNTAYGYCVELTATGYCVYQKLTWIQNIVIDLWKKSQRLVNTRISKITRKQGEHIRSTLTGLSFSYTLLWEPVFGCHWRQKAGSRQIQVLVNAVTLFH